MIYVGIDDTDIVGTPGTNQLARAILRRLGPAAQRAVICRHQLFFDPRVPYTSKNGSASIQLPALEPARIRSLVADIREVMRAWFVAGSDPGLCISAGAPSEVQQFGQRCKCEVVTREQARSVAAGARMHLEGLGGTEQGIIGALAAVGLIATGEDGRLVHLASWPYPDELCGAQGVATIHARGIAEIREAVSNAPITTGSVDVGKHLRPNIRGGRIVLLVERNDESAGPPWKALKLT